jgi:hypothetical protein
MYIVFLSDYDEKTTIYDFNEKFSCFCIIITE